ncbi:MAG TPA: type IVB secretion system protein IcmH/DotU [Polyangiaceae bacterium]
MYWVCADCLTLAMQLAGASDLPAPQVLRQRITTLLETMRARGNDANIPQQDVGEAMYAIVAFMDEQILRSEWPGRQQWMNQPLQLTYFNENTAGEGFFTRMQALQEQPNRAPVLEIFYLCLALGFQGKYAVPGTGDIGAVTEHTAALLNRRLPNSDEISARGSARDNTRTLVPRGAPLVMVSAGLLALAVLGFVVLLIVSRSNASSAADRIRREAPARPAAPVSALERRPEALDQEQG